MWGVGKVGWGLNCWKTTSIPVTDNPKTKRPIKSPLEITCIGSVLLLLPSCEQEIDSSSTLCCRKMDRSSFSPGTRRTRPKSEIYSTFVVHDDEDDDNGETSRRWKAGSSETQDDPYATMLYKDNGHDDDEDDEDSSLPPLLKRLPKDFGGGSSMDYDNDDNDAGDFGTVIVKSDRSRQRDRPPSGIASPAGSTWRAGSSSQASTFNRHGGDDNDDDGGGFSTFVVRSTVKSGERESVSGTVVRRTGGGGVGSTMERAVASMQAAGEFGFGKQRKGSVSSQNEEGKQQSITTKVSTSSIPDSVTREDPTTKYELLNELGRFQIVDSGSFLLYYYPLLFCFACFVDGLCSGNCCREGILWCCLQSEGFKNF